MLDYEGNGSHYLYTLQHINTYVFKTGEVMSNIALVTDHLRKNILKQNADPDRRVLELVPTRKARIYKDESGEVWRAYRFIDNASA